MRFAPGRTPRWRHAGSVQLGVDPDHAVLLDELTPALADLVRRIDGSTTVPELLAALPDAATADTAARLLDELADHGFVEPAHHAERVPDALAADIASWAIRTGNRTGNRADDVLARRAAATVVVRGSGRIAIGIACGLAAAGVGAVVVRTRGDVTPSDIGTGVPASDIGTPRALAVPAAVERARVLPACEPLLDLPDCVVLADEAAWDPTAALALTADRVPHLAAHAHEVSVVVGPLVLPGRTSCLRCADLYRADHDPSWPRIVAQLAASPPPASLPAAHVAIGVAVEQVLALLVGRGEATHAPPLIGATCEIDALCADTVRRVWPPHPRCGCGAAPRPVTARSPTPDRRRQRVVTGDTAPGGSGAAPRARESRA